MASTPKPSRVSYIILRYMRRPIMVLIVVYAVAMGGMVLIPGPVVDVARTHEVRGDRRPTFFDGGV